jgi:hypothetical protein
MNVSVCGLNARVGLLRRITGLDAPIGENYGRKQRLQPEIGRISARSTGSGIGGADSRFSMTE